MDAAKPFDNLLNQVKKLLDENHPDEALRLLARSRDTAPLLQNARAVCLMRMDQADDALRLLTPLVFPRGGMAISHDVPLATKVNYITAMLLKGNLAGCSTVLGELRDEKSPAVERLRKALDDWKKSQGLGRRFLMLMGAYPFNARVPLTFLPGEI